MKPFFDIQDIDCLLVAHHDGVLECGAFTKELDFKVRPLLERIAKLEEALKYYADEKNYTDDYRAVTAASPLILQEWGRKAREALKK